MTWSCTECRECKGKNRLLASALRTPTDNPGEPAAPEEQTQRNGALFAIKKKEKEPLQSHFLVTLRVVSSIRQRGAHSFRGEHVGGNVMVSICLGNKGYNLVLFLCCLSPSSEVRSLFLPVSHSR